MDHEKHGVNMVYEYVDIWSEYVSDLRKLYFIKTMGNVICCLKVRLLTDI